MNAAALDVLRSVPQHHLNRYVFFGNRTHRLLSKYRTSIDLERSVLRLTAQPSS